MVYIDQAIDDIFIDINDDDSLKNQLIEFARFKTSINKSWDISHDLREFIVLIDKESNRDQIEYFSQKNREFFSQIKLEVNNLKNEKKENLRNHAKNSIELISTNGLDFGDFRGSYFPIYLNNIIINDQLYINESIYKSLNGETSLYNKSLSNSKSDIIEKIRSLLLNNYNEINKIILIIPLFWLNLMTKHLRIFYQIDVMYIQIILLNLQTKEFHFQILMIFMSMVPDYILVQLKQAIWF